MNNYNNILNMFSLVLALIILFIILFGCKCQKGGLFERFENAEMKKEEKFDAKDTKKDLLSNFEKSVLDGLSAGSITSKDLTSLIKNEQFTEKNLDNLITYVEKFKGGLLS